MRVRFIIFILFSIFSNEVFSQQATVDSLENIALRGNDRDRLAALTRLANLFRNTDPGRSLTYAEDALNVAGALRDDQALAQASQMYASIAFRLGNFMRARQYYQQALGLYEAISYDKGKAEVQNALASIFYAQGNLAAAVEYYLNALRYYELSGDQVGMVNIYASLSVLYARQNNFSKSIEYNLKAIAFYEHSSNKLQALVGYDQIGNGYLKLNNLSKAAEFFNRSLRSYTEQNNTAGIASTLHQLGNIAARQKQFPLALSYYNRSLQMSQAMDTRPLTVVNMNAIAGVHVEMKAYDKAVVMYKRTIGIAKSTDGMKIELEEAYQGLSEIYRLTEQTEKASTFNTLSRELKDSLYNDSALRRLSDIQLSYEAEKRQQQIELLSKEQQIKSSELLRQRQQNRWVLITAIVACIVIIVLGYFYILNKRFSNNLQKKTVEITEKTEKLGQLNSVKDRFFSIISHDLRNNLTTMKLYFDLISNPAYKSADHSEVTKQISSSVENTIDLLENLLVWASAQIKGIPIHIQKLQLNSLAQENTDLLNGTASQKRITLSNEVPVDAFAYADMDMINLVIRNLVSNAIKFTPEEGKISVGATQDDKFCTVYVRDNGVGISPENLQKLFDQHQHPTTKGTGNEKGTGLGLMLCKDFVERNNGTISVQSEKQKGTTFSFTLPLHAEVSA